MKKGIGFILLALFVGIAVSYMLFGARKEQKGSVAMSTPTDQVTPVVTNTETPSSPTPGKSKTYTTAPAMSIDINKTYRATMVTSKGTMKFSLFAKETPITVNNFVFLSRAGFYDNTVFHRIIKGFMIQGGDPQGNGMGGPGYRFADEPVARDYTRGTLAMANAGPNTNGSQFFIMHADYGLPKQYVIFGTIDAGDTESMKTLDAIASTPVGSSGSGEQSSPLEKVTVLSVTIEEG
jgi:cyclophilin family peptidyl-prolyl cis-trans isomerase